MELELQRPIVFFDIESTGLDIPHDSIVELSFVKVFPGGEQRIKTWKIKPWDYEAGKQRPLNPSAAEVNGIKDEELVNCPRFCDVADEVILWLEDCDLSGFNSAKFDLPMLAEELERVRKYCGKDITINLHEKKMIDVQVIYHHMEPRSLRAAYRLYCGGEDYDKAHTAEADSIATYEVLKGQLDRYPALKNDVSYLAGFGGRSKNVDYAGRLSLNENQEIVVNFGKHKGKTAREVFKTEPSYFAWIAQGDFTLDTKRQFELLKEKFMEERNAEKRGYKPLSSKPLDENEVKDAAQMLKDHFTGSLF